jgi:hypothetical protein
LLDDFYIVIKIPDALRLGSTRFPRFERPSTREWQMTKTPIDHKRDSGGMAHIGTVEEGAAGLMVEIDGSLYIIKEKAIYALQHADQIDPEHTNIELPNIIPRHVLSVGSDSELVGKTLLTAVSLFDKWKFLPERFDHAKALSLSFKVLTTVVSMRTIAEEFETAKLKAHADANRGSPDGNSSAWATLKIHVELLCSRLTMRLVRSLP